MPKTADRRQAKRAASLPQRRVRAAARAAVTSETAAPVGAPTLPPPPAGGAWLEYADGSRGTWTDRGDGRRIVLAGAVYDICGVDGGVPVFRFVLQEPLPG
jgi:hypothetical protein